MSTELRKSRITGARKRAQRMAAKQVQVLGLKELRADLTRLDNINVPKAMIEAGMKAVTPIANAIKASLPHKSGRLAGSTRVARIRTGGNVRVGAKAVPYVGPVEFGGYPGARAFVRDGRYIFPVAHSMAPQATELYSQLIQEAINRNGWTEVYK
jgi:hypothetical protein